jgi:hypothetical protein
MEPGFPPPAAGNIRFCNIFQLLPKIRGFFRQVLKIEVVRNNRGSIRLAILINLIFNFCDVYAKKYGGGGGGG